MTVHTADYVRHVDRAVPRYNKRFGIHHVDFKTKKRTPSADWYREVISRNAVE